MDEKKIFVTVGTQLPFPRIFDYVHHWSKSTDIPHRVYAQVAETDIKHPFHQIQKYLGSDEFNSWFSQADCVVAHAGMGTIIESSINSKPLIIVPREAKSGEHRNDHQIHTAQKFKGLANVRVATCKKDFYQYLNDFLGNGLNKGSVLYQDGLRSGVLGESLDRWIANSFEAKD